MLLYLGASSEDLRDRALSWNLYLDLHPHIFRLLLLFLHLLLHFAPPPGLLRRSGLLALVVLLLLLLPLLAPGVLEDHLLLNRRILKLHILWLADPLILIVLLLLALSPLAVPVKLQYHFDSLLKDRTLVCRCLYILVDLYLNKNPFDS